MSALEQLLDAFAAAAQSGDPMFRCANLSLHGDSAVAAATDWAVARGLAALPQRRSDGRKEWTCTEILPAGHGPFINVFSDSRPIQAATEDDLVVSPYHATQTGGAL